MNILPGLLLASALIFATANATSAYHWSSSKKSVKLRGSLEFTPDDGGKQFKCLVSFDFKTKKSIVTAGNFPHGFCNGVHFSSGFPWSAHILTENSGNFGGGSFLSGNGGCTTGGTQFQVDGSGIFTLPSGQCLSGTLTSKPPVTIEQ